MKKITHCKLNKNIQKRLFEFFVLEVTARSAANILDIQSNTAILFYQKIRKVIEWNLAQESTHMFDGCIELNWMKAILAVFVKETEVEVRQEK